MNPSKIVCKCLQDEKKNTGNLLNPQHCSGVYLQCFIIEMTFGLISFNFCHHGFKGFSYCLICLSIISKVVVSWKPLYPYASLSMINNLRAHLWRGKKNSFYCATSGQTLQREPLTNTPPSYTSSHLTFGKKTNKLTSKAFTLFQSSLHQGIYKKGVFDLTLKLSNTLITDPQQCVSMNPSVPESVCQSLSHLEEMLTLKINKCIRSTSSSYCYK